MDHETEKKLIELQHQQNLLSERVEGNMKTMRAENGEALAKNEAAIAELLKDNEKLRTDMEKSINANTTKLMVFTGVAIAVVGVLVSNASLIINLALK